MNYLIYTRVSPRGSDWQGETSCEAQAAECRRHVEMTDKAAVFTELREEFVSGTSLKKRALAGVLQTAAQGGADWDVLIALDLDRLFRSTEECLAAFRTLADAGKGIILVRQNIDLASPYGRFTLTILAAVAQLTAQIGAQKTKDKMYYIARQGLWPCGKTPLGYKRGGKSDNRLQVDPDHALTVRAMFEAAAAGHGPVYIARQFNMPKNTVTKILLNPIYTGRLVYGAVDVKGQHEPIIDDALWHSVQKTGVARVQDRAHPDQRQYAYLLSGLVRCQCGQALSPATCRGRGGQYPYYRCQNPACKSTARYVRADLLEKAILDAITQYAYSDDQVKALAKHEAKHHADLLTGQLPQKIELQQGLDTARAEIARLTGALAAADGGGLGGANRAILEALERRQQEADHYAQELDALRGRFSVSEIAQDAAHFAESWRAMAQTLAAGAGDAKTRTDWVRSHVQEIASVVDGWKLRLFVPLAKKGSTERTLWHPVGASVELMLALVVRQRGRAA